MLVQLVSDTITVTVLTSEAKFRGQGYGTVQTGRMQNMFWAG
jgi:hypothetical protein